MVCSIVGVLCAQSALLAQSSLLPPIRPSETVLMPEQLSNRRLDYLSDATAVGWNPAMLGVRPQFDLALSSVFSGSAVSGSFMTTSAKFGAFLKIHSFGIGYSGNPRARNSSGELYFGFGLPIVDDVLWGGASARLSLAAPAPYLDYNGSFLFKPLVPGLLFSLGATTMAMDMYSAATDNNYRRVAPGLVQFLGNALYSLPGGDLTLLASARSASLLNPTLPGFETGVSWNLLNAAVVLSGSVQWLPQPAVRLGLEVNSEIFDALYGLRLQEAQQLEHSVVLRFSSDKINSASEIRSLRADAESALCIGRPVAAFDDAAVFLAALPKLNPYLAEMLAENGLASDSAALYANVRKQFYGRSVAAAAIGSTKGSDNASSGVGVESTKGYGIELKRIDKTLFPLEAKIVRVVDSAGRTLTGLSSLDFRTRDTSRRIVSVRRLDSVTTVPVDIVLLLDCSGSMRNTIAEVREQIGYFLNELRKSGANARVGAVSYGVEVLDVLQPTEHLDRVEEFLARATASQNNEYTPAALDELVGMKFRTDAERIGIVLTDEIMYSNRKPMLRELLTLRDLWAKGISLHKVIKPCANNGEASAYLTLGREYSLNEPFTDIVRSIGREKTALYAVMTAPVNMTSSYFSGTVRSGDGQPQIAFITLTDAEANIIGPFRTAADGTFRQAIPEGKKYRLFVQPLHSDSVGIVVRTLDASRLLKGDTLKQDVMLLPPTILRGNVRDERGAPLQADIYLEDNLGFEFPVTATKRLKSGEMTGNYKLVIVPGRKYRVKAVPVRSTLFEPLEYELDARSFKAGDTLEQTFTLRPVQQYVLVEGTVLFGEEQGVSPETVSSESISRESASALSGMRVTVRNQANNDVVKVTETNADGIYTFRLPKGVSAEIVIEPSSWSGYTPSRWRAFFRKSDTLAVARAITTLSRRLRTDEDEMRSAKQSLETVLTEARNVQSKPSAEELRQAISQMPVQETVLELPRREVRMPEIKALMLSFADTKAVLPMVIDSAGVLSKRPWEEVVERLAAELKREKRLLAKVVIIGHTDETASPDANQAEGWQRAEFVRQELLKRGLPESLVTATSQGNSQLLPRNPKESAFTYKARCRRVEVMKIWKAE
ncbi:MAG: OmpA family protein [Candidatus Kapabacteria bacterium]|nr:OmpA family protein [Candidatus Kapabacteria bacterium]